MTTTLRPTGPLQEEADGARSRAYEVCVNSRPVGTIEIATLPSLGPWAGTIRSLRIEAPDRGRGRGTVAALAAEEVLRAWRCTQIQVSLPPESIEAARLATALGYVERSRNMSKPLNGPPPSLPEGVRARSMTDGEFAVWWETGLKGYARSWAARGLSPDQALAKAEADRTAGLPDGLATAGVRLEVLVSQGETVGHLYLGRGEIRPGERGAYVYEVEVVEAHRGRGLGRALMLLAEQRALADGVQRIGLHVFAGNTPAHRLYESLGYRTDRVNSAKPLL
ncbi:GNAT family N-acetyltransferase [Streptomyces albipurpureus]|uniref:GNAT family N-acetyltransferase n=1 Tax=Streptomyces albipurpureus TaxID=2897419 RepID=A0ABT0V0C5_9ACTN|nr:GNAT family N-acetyltransferase [Streptomyces sp. CWNU-1]MCM2392861.1 GNAT family N-acetyltransferase [Streptomyces sp. CWNU-1]